MPLKRDFLNILEVKNFKSKMLKQNLKFDGKDELEILSEQLDSKELYILGYLKGFDRKTLKEWDKKGLMDFSLKI